MATIAPTGLEVDRFVQARAVELRCLLSAAGDGESSGARRRTRSHSRRKQMFWTRKRRQGPASGKRSREEGAPLSRRVRRRIAFQQLAQGQCTAGGGKLATHVWHAKRFHMVDLWGYRLALGATGRGHGTRALLRRAKEGALLHDASYWSPIQLEATRSAALGVLGLVAEPVPDLSATAHCSSYVNAMVYRCGKRDLSPLAPVMVHSAASTPTGDSVKLWIWVHAAALPEVLDSLQSACEGTPARCWLRKGEFARLEVLGAKPLEVLRKVIRPRSTVDWWERQDEQAAVAVEVDDPRDVSMLRECQQSLSAESRSAHPAPVLFASSDLEPPLSEKSMNRKRQRYRLAHYRLRGQQKHDPSEWRSCHMLLLKHGSHALCGWSIVLPLSWVQPFWSQLIHAGASVVGQRERRWLMTYAGRASYPYDFADCPAYALMQHTGSEPCLPPGGLVVARSRHLEAQHDRDEGGCVFELDSGCKLFWPAVQAPFVRTLLRSAGRGVPQEGCRLYAPSAEEFQSWTAGLQKWQGVEGDLTRKPVGFVTSAPPRRCQAPASAVCDLGDVCRVRSWELADQLPGSCKMKDQVMLLFQNPGSSKLRPALARIAADEGF